MSLFSAFKKERKEEKKPFFAATFVMKKEDLAYDNAIPKLKGKKLEDFNEKFGGVHQENYEENKLIFSEVPLVKTAISEKASHIASDTPRIVSENEKMMETGNKLIEMMEEKDLFKKIALDMHKYGNCFLENKSDIDNGILNFAIWKPQRMHVHKDGNGIVDKYVQKNNFSKDVDFTIGEMTHFKLNAEDEDDYGTSDIHSIRQNLNFKLSLGKNMNVIVERKTNAPFVVTVGNHEDVADEDTIKNIKQDFSTLGSKTEWIFSHLVKVEAIGFKDKILDVKPYIEEFERQIKFGLAVPDVLLGEGSIPEGLAKVQEKNFWVKIREDRKNIKTSLKKKIFDLHFELLGFDLEKDKYNIIWEKDSEEESLKKIVTLTPLLKPDIIMTPSTKIAIENKIRLLLGIEKEIDEKDLPKKENGGKEENKLTFEQFEKAIKIRNEHTRSDELYDFSTNRTEENAKEYYNNETDELIGFEERIKTQKEYIVELSKRRDNLKENFLFLDGNPTTIEALTGLDYSLFKKETIDFLDKYDFKIKGKSIVNFKTKDNDTLRSILKDGVRNNKSIANIEKNVETIGALQKEDKKIRKLRATNIARSEMIRATNAGSLQMYKNSGLVEKVEFLAAGSSRTCPICLALNENVYEIKESKGVIPVHPMCRCLIDYQIPIYTSKGWKQIGKIKKGELVLTHKGKMKRVKEIMPRKRYKGEIITIETDNITKHKNQKGTPIKLSTTPEHPYFVDGKWVEAKDLKEKMEIEILAKKCKECGAFFPWIKRNDAFEFCSQKCFNSFSAKKQFKDLNNEQYKFMNIKIKTIKKWFPKKPKKLYNFSVEDDESYIAHGFVTHNCSWIPILEKEEPMKDEKGMQDYYADEFKKMKEHYIKNYGKDYKKKLYPKDFTDDDALSIFAYSIYSYKPTNMGLRAGKVLEKKYEVLKNNLDNALKKISIYENKDVLRRISFFDKKKFDKFVKKAKKDRTVIDKAFMSTTDKADLLNYFSATGEYYIDFKIKQKTAKNISKFSNYIGENEIIVPRSTKFKIKKIRTGKGEYGVDIAKIEMEEI